MDAAETGTGIDRYYQAIQQVQAEVIKGQREAMIRAAGLMAETIQNEGRIFIFGTGHSHLMAEEAFYRAGGLAAMVPIVSTALMVHEHPALSSALERKAGLAAVLLDSYSPRPGEGLIIFSNSGVNQLPVEMAVAGKERGLWVVSVSSFSYAAKAPLSAVGKRLHEIADIAIDNNGQPGDAMVEIPGVPWLVGPSSTNTGALILNCLVTETASQLRLEGEEIPVFASFNMPGAQEHNRRLLEKWRVKNRHL